MPPNRNYAATEKDYLSDILDELVEIRKVLTEIRDESSTNERG